MTEQQQTTVAVKPQRADVDPATFADLTDVPVSSVAWVDGGLLAVTFDGLLDAATVARVRDRLLTTDADQEAGRAEIRSLMAEGCCALCEAVARYVLGD